MKRNLLIALTIFSNIIVMAGNDAKIKIKGNGSLPSTSVIDSGDTVVFDFSQQTSIGTLIEFPVSFISDDTIFSLDFSFKYDEINFLYDTTIDLAANLQSVSYYNSNDSTVRYTSFSLQSMTNDTALVLVRFFSNLGIMCGPDINTVKGYLNGEFCSVKIINCDTALSSGIEDVGVKQKSLSIYPNPANQIINVESPVDATIQLFDLSCKVLLTEKKLYGGVKSQINISDIPNGLYMLKTSCSDYIRNEKIIINH